MTAKNISRRDFLNLSLVAGGAVAITEGLFVGLRFLSPRVTEGEFGGQFNLGPYEQYPPGSVTPVEAGRFYLVRLQDSGFLAVYQRCTHLGCSVPYDQASGQFVCPCHGSRFTTEGDVLNPPAPRALDIFQLSVSDAGDLIVDTGTIIERVQADLSQVVYPQG
jgi:cytochrome b6-f complex iron-sulfur subunit